MADWISTRPDCLVLLSKELDKYGRVLGDLQNIYNRETLSGYLISKKLAHAYDGGTKPVWTAAEYAAILALQIPTMVPGIATK